MLIVCVRRKIIKRRVRKNYNGGCGGGGYGGDADKISYREIARARVRIKTMLEFRRW